jgi:butyryl-CoA dehydrogenase
MGCADRNALFAEAAMDFTPTEEHKMIREMCREFALNELAPTAEETDRERRFPAQHVKRMAELGLMGVCVPEEYGGAGMDTISYAIAVEELAAGCGSTSLVMAVNNSLACGPLNDWGTDEQKKKWLTPLASGEKLGCFALTEANAGSDAANLASTAVLDGKDYVLNGNKLFISNAAEADTCIVFAVTDKTVDRHKGISAFVADMKTPGITVSKHERKLGMHGCSTCEIVFENARIPKENLLGKEGGGFKVAMKTLDGGRISIAAQAVGLAHSAFHRAVQFAKERVQFGKPIATKQAIQWMIADMAVGIRAARWLTYHAAWLKDRGEPCNREAAMAKVRAAEVSNFVCNKALQVHGGYGYTEDYDVERMLRDARITEIYEGTSEVQRIVIAHSYLRD